MDVRLLVGDVGGTHCRLATWTAAAGLHDVWVTPTAEVRTLAETVAAYRRHHLSRDPQAACIAVAGPVSADGQQARLTNTDWSGHVRELPCPVGVLINDLHAAARGLSALSPADCIALGGPPPPTAALSSQAMAVAAVMGVGTGLGQALLVGDRVVPGEGGHAGFSPTDAVQMRLHQWLQGQLGRVSVEAVVSGPGLGRLLRFFVEQEGLPLSAAASAARAATSDSSVVLAFAEQDAACSAALDLFLRAAGSAAGDLALRVLPERGVFLCGGVLPRALSAVQDGRLRAAFEDKAPMDALLRAVPCVLVTHPHLGLLGAVAEAQRVLAA